jgi:DnaJ-domain-containing protein 1
MFLMFKYFQLFSCVTSILYVAQAAFILQTNIYFPDIPTQVLSVCEGQRPEDAVANFLGMFQFISIESERNMLNTVMTFLCDALETSDLNLKCTTRVPTELTTILDISHLGHHVKSVNVRAGLDATVEAECVCSFMECQLEAKKRIEAAIMQSISTTSTRSEETNVTEMQFASSNLYEVLGLSNEDIDDVTEVAIKRKYRELARRYHPDKNLNRVDWATEVFKNITNAYETLVDPDRRRRYDMQSNGRGDQHSSQENNVMFSTTPGTTQQTFHFETSSSGSASFGFTFTFG